MIDLQFHFLCVWIHRNSLHLFLTASLTSKYQFNIKGSVGVHASVSCAISTRAHACVSPLLTTKCKLYFNRSVNRKYTLGLCGEAGLMCPIFVLLCCCRRLNDFSVVCVSQKFRGRRRRPALTRLWVWRTSGILFRFISTRPNESTSTRKS